MDLLKADIQKNIPKPFKAVCPVFPLTQAWLLDKRTNSGVIPHQPYDEMKRKDDEEQSTFSVPIPRSVSSSLSPCFPATVLFSFFFFFAALSVFQSLPATEPPPPHNPTLPLRAARHRAVLYFFAHFSQRLVPSHADPYRATVQRGRRWRKRVIFSPWVRTPHDKW